MPLPRRPSLLALLLLITCPATTSAFDVELEIATSTNGKPATRFVRDASPDTTVVDFVARVQDLLANDAGKDARITRMCAAGKADATEQDDDTTTTTAAAASCESSHWAMFANIGSGQLPRKTQKDFLDSVDDATTSTLADVGVTADANKVLLRHRGTPNGLAGGVFGGEGCQPGWFRWMGSLQKTSGNPLTDIQTHKCGVSIFPTDGGRDAEVLPLAGEGYRVQAIGLTARHCVRASTGGAEGDDMDVTWATDVDKMFSGTARHFVSVGTSLLKQSEASSAMRIPHLEVLGYHTTRGLFSLGNDVALLFLGRFGPREASYDALIRDVAPTLGEMPADASDRSAEATFAHAGWGEAHKFDHPSTGERRASDAKRVQLQCLHDITQRYPDPARNFLGGAPEVTMRSKSSGFMKEQGINRGDSGGPLVWTKAKDNIVGVVSSGFATHGVFDGQRMTFMNVETPNLAVLSILCQAFSNLVWTANADAQSWGSGGAAAAAAAERRGHPYVEEAPAAEQEEAAGDDDVPIGGRTLFEKCKARRAEWVSATLDSQTTVVLGPRMAAKYESGAAAARRGGWARRPNFLKAWASAASAAVARNGWSLKPPPGAIEHLRRHIEKTSAPGPEEGGGAGAPRPREPAGADAGGDDAGAAGPSFGAFKDQLTRQREARAHAYKEHQRLKRQRAQAEEEAAKQRAQVDEREMERRRGMMREAFARTARVHRQGGEGGAAGRQQQQQQQQQANPHRPPLRRNEHAHRMWRGERHAERGGGRVIGPPPHDSSRVTRVSWLSAVSARDDDEEEVGEEILLEV